MSTGFTTDDNLANAAESKTVKLTHKEKQKQRKKLKRQALRQKHAQFIEASQPPGNSHDIT